MALFHHTFQPYKIGTVKLKNTLIMAPITTLYVTEQGEVSNRAIDFFVERACGGVGMIIAEATFIQPGENAFIIVFTSTMISTLPALKNLKGAVKKAEANISIQLSHG